MKHAQRDDAWSAQERLIQPVAWEFDEDAARATSAQWQATLNWSVFNRWVEGPTVFILFRSAEDFRVYPKRAFVSPEQVEQFRRLLELKVIPASTRGFPITRLPSKSA